MIGSMDDSLPPFVQPSASKRPLILISIIGLALIVGGGMLLWRSAPPLSVPTPTPFAPKRTIVVDVQGAVLNPGLQTHERAFGVDLRIGELLASAGGLLATADQSYVSKHMNLSAKVEDGEKFYIPRMGEIVSDTTTTPSQKEGRLPVNTATKEELLNLKGIGETRAQTILSTRPYRSFDDFSKKTAFPQSVLSALEPLLNF